MITLQTLCEGDHHRAVEERVLTVAFLGASPTRIASDVGIRRSDHDSALVIFRTLKNVASFVAFDLPGLFQQLRIPRLAEPDALLKRRRRNRQRSSPLAWTTLRQPVNAFDVTARCDPETRHTRICIETLDLLVDRHQRENVVDALLDRKVRILKRILLG